MKVAFVDTLYFVALFNPRNQWHERAIAASKLVAETKLITTEDVLVELLLVTSGEHSLKPFEVRGQY